MTARRIEPGVQAIYEVLVPHGVKPRGRGTHGTTLAAARQLAGLLALAEDHGEAVEDVVEMLDGWGAHDVDPEAVVRAWERSLLD